MALEKGDVFVDKYDNKVIILNVDERVTTYQWATGDILTADNEREAEELENFLELRSVTKVSSE